MVGGGHGDRVFEIESFGSASSFNGERIRVPFFLGRIGARLPGCFLSLRLEEKKSVLPVLISWHDWYDFSISSLEKLGYCRAIDAVAHKRPTDRIDKVWFFLSGVEGRTPTLTNQASD